MSSARPYRPIACSLHDQLEAASTLHKLVKIAYLSSDGALVEIESRIVDILTSNGVEFVKLERGAEIRLDDLRMVDGIVFEQGGDC